MLVHLPRLPSPWMWAAVAVAYIVCGNICGFSLYIPTSRARLNPTCMATREPVQRPWIALSKRRSPILRQRETYRAMSTAVWQVDKKLQRSTIFSIMPLWAQQTRLCLWAAACFARLNWATFVMETSPPLEGILLFGERKQCPLLTMIVLPYRPT